MNKERLQEIKDSIELQMIYEQNSSYRKEYSSKLKEEIDLYNEVVRLQSNEENLIKYLEDKMNEIRIGGCDCLTTKMFETEKRVYREVLERLKSGKYE